MLRSSKKSSKGLLQALEEGSLQKQRLAFISHLWKGNIFTINVFSVHLFVVSTSFLCIFLICVYFFFVPVSSTLLFLCCVRYASVLVFNLSSLKVRSDASSPSFSGHSMTKSQRFELDLDEPLAFVHKSSVAIAKAKLNQGRQHSAEVAIQTEREVTNDHCAWTVSQCSN